MALKRVRPRVSSIGNLIYTAESCIWDSRYTETHEQTLKSLEKAREKMQRALNLLEDELNRLYIAGVS